jgi:hypothetical protein
MTRIATKSLLNSSKEKEINEKTIIARTTMISNDIAKGYLIKAQNAKLI